MYLPLMLSTGEVTLIILGIIGAILLIIAISGFKIVNILS